MAEFKLEEKAAPKKRINESSDDFNIHRASTIIGLGLFILVPIISSIYVITHFAPLLLSKLQMSSLDQFLEINFWKNIGILVSVIIFLAIMLGWVWHVLSEILRKNRKKIIDEQKYQAFLTSDDSSKNKMNQENKTEGKSVDPSDDKKKEAERLAKEKADKEAAEKDRLNKKIEQARKDFESKISILRKSIPSKIDITPENESYDFSICIKESGLKFNLITKSLPLYMEWSQDKSKISVLDRKPFILAKNFTFDVEISDPVADTDSELKSHLKPQILPIQLVAKYPKPAEKFIEWTKGIADQVRLANVKQGSPTKFNLVELLAFDPSWGELMGTEDASNSLILDRSTNTLGGVVKDPANDIKIIAQFECKAMPSLKHSVTLLLTCTMDPETRWKQIEQSDSDKIPVLTESETEELKKMSNGVRKVPPSYGLDEIFSKPNRVSNRQVKAGFDLAYASIRGRSHIKDGKFREDDVNAGYFLDHKAVAIVVSDGAGSASLSRRGSKIVANLGLETLIKSFEKLLAEDPNYFLNTLEVEGIKNKVKDIFTNAVSNILQRIDVESDIIRSAKPTFNKKDMYATFLAAVVLPSKNGHILFSYSVGDGAIGVGGASDDVSGLKCVPDHGQSAGQTLFVQSEGATDANKRLNITIIPGAFSLILMSDGVSDPLIPLDDECKPQTWHSLATQLKSIVDSEVVSEVEKSETYQQRGKLCEWLDSYQLGHHDDRTIATLRYNPSSL
jgi:Protein phosphatase 2C